MGGFGEGGGGAAVGPAAGEGDVDAEAELAAFSLGVADVVEHLGAEEGFVDEVFGGVVEDLRVDEGEFRSADAVWFSSAGARGGSPVFQRRFRTTTSGPWGGRRLVVAGTVALGYLSGLLMIKEFRQTIAKITESWRRGFDGLWKSLWKGLHKFFLLAGFEVRLRGSRDGCNGSNWTEQR